MTIPEKNILIKEFKNKYNKDPKSEELEQFAYWYKNFKIKKIGKIHLIKTH